MVATCYPTRYLLNPGSASQPTQSETDSYFRKLALREGSIVTLKQQGFTNIEDLLLLADSDLQRLKLSMRDEIKPCSSLSDAIKPRGAVTKSTNEQSFCSSVVMENEHTE